jgi:hypothetical protein
MLNGDSRDFCMKSNSNDPNSLSARARAKRFKVFVDLLQKSGLKNAHVLDIGGTLPYWRIHAGYLPAGIVSTIDVVNLPPTVDSTEVVNGVTLQAYGGDALDKSTLRSAHYDLVYSNSVIEHVGGLRAQLAMARNAISTGRFYFVQTPCRSFPIEPHFYFPFFAQLPLDVRTWLHSHFTLGFMGRRTDWLEARMWCEETRLLSLNELKAIFPGGQVHKERLLGLTKSHMITNLAQ